MQDNLRVYFKDKYFFESLVKKKGSFNVTLNSEINPIIFDNYKKLDTIPQSV
ncbi:hypothetical protein SAMN05880573_1331 [Chryseobacterium sp. RU33C]|nr:hypothetical protein SAMN05880573_1331 [Chryseobacterium sp. RU33C]